MDLASVALSGLAAALLASGIAYLGARKLQGIATERRERGAARAVYYEVATIASDMITALHNGLPMPDVSTATYDRAVADLAVFLAPTDFDKVAYAYYSVHLYLWHAPSGTSTPPDLQMIIGRFTVARDVLEHAAFTPTETAQRRQVPS